MLSCVVRGCKSNSARHGHLAFFPIPKDSSLRDEWMDVLSLKNRQIVESTRICELHFRDKDFCASNIPGRKTLKHHALPVLHIGKNSVNIGDSDEEFMQCGSDSDPEIVEVKKLSQQMSASAQQQPAVEVKQEPEDTDMPSTEADTGRRPSRRAAQLAVKKIHNTVRSFALTPENISQDVNVQKESPPKPVQRVRNASTPQKAPTRKFRDQKTWHSIRVPPQTEGTLFMECHEELLTAVQAEALMKAQSEYNNVMKMLRGLKASNVKITCEPAEKPQPIPDDEEVVDDYVPYVQSPMPPPQKGSGTISNAGGDDDDCDHDDNVDLHLTVTGRSIRAKPASLMQTSNGGITIVPVRVVTVQPPCNASSLLVAGRSASSAMIVSSKD